MAWKIKREIGGIHGEERGREGEEGRMIPRRIQRSNKQKKNTKNQKNSEKHMFLKVSSQNLKIPYKKSRFSAEKEGGGGGEDDPKEKSTFEQKKTKKHKKQENQENHVFLKVFSPNLIIPYQKSRKSLAQSKKR